MSEKHLNFSIGSVFSGEGFKQAQSAVGTLNKSVATAAGAVDKVSSAMGGMDSSAGKAVQSVTNLVNAFMTGGLVGGGVTLAIVAVSKAISMMKEAAEAAKKQAAELRQNYVNLAGTLNQQIFDKAIADADTISKNFERITKQANALTSAMNTLSREQAQGGILDLQAEKVVAVMNEITSEGAALKAAEYDFRIATEKAANTRAQGEQDIAKAHQAIVDAENRVANFAEQRAAIEEQVGHLQNNIAAVEKRIADATAEEKEKYKSDLEKWRANLRTLQQREAAIDQAVADEKDKLKILAVEEQTATRKAANANRQAEAAVTALTAAAEARARQEREAFQKKHDELEQQEELARLNDEAKSAQENLNAAKRNTERCEKEYAEALKKFNANYAQNQINHAILNQERGKGELITPTRISKEVVGDIVKHERDERFKNGDFKSVRDMQRFERDRAKEIQQQIETNERQTMREAQRYEQLKGRSDRSLSRQDREFKKNFEELQARDAMQFADLEAARQEAERAKEAEEEQRSRALTAQEEAAKYTKEIRDKLDNLGLK